MKAENVKEGTKSPMHTTWRIKKPLNNQEQQRTGQIIKHMLLTIGDDEECACVSSSYATDGLGLEPI
jgi:hypothetical protein